jgi:exosortase family protein XrtF
MKKYLITYRPFLKFLLVFFLTYGVLTFCYNQYLGMYQNLPFPIDPFTENLSYQVKAVGELFMDKVEIQKHLGEKWTRLVYNDRYIARIVEGCNGISVMILFVAFVVAFARKFLPAFIFCVSGIILIHILNVFRIAVLGYFIYTEPERTHIYHGVLFPLVIYGFVFMLWVVWVRQFSGFITKGDAKKD